MAGHNTSLHFDLESTTVMAHSSGAVVGRLSADQVVAQWNISDDRFIVEDGLLRLKSGVEIDDESKSLDITITGVDSDGYLSAQSFDMTVIDPNNDNDEQTIFGAEGLEVGDVDEMEEGNLEEEEDESEERSEEDFDQVAQGIGGVEVTAETLTSNSGIEEIDSTDEGSSVGAQSTAGGGVESVEANMATEKIRNDEDAPSFSDEDPLFSMSFNDNEAGNLSEDAFILDNSKISETLSVQAVGSEDSGDDLVFDIIGDEDEGDIGQPEMEDFGQDEDMGDDMEMEFEDLDI